MSLRIFFSPVVAAFAPCEARKDRSLPVGLLHPRAAVNRSCLRPGCCAVSSCCCVQATPQLKQLTVPSYLLYLVTAALPPVPRIPLTPTCAARVFFFCSNTSFLRPASVARFSVFPQSPERLPVFVGGLPPRCIRTYTDV